MACIFNYAGRYFYAVGGIDGDQAAVKSAVEVWAHGYAVFDGIVMGEAKGHDVAGVDKGMAIGCTSTCFGLFQFLIRELLQFGV